MSKSQPLEKKRPESPPIKQNEAGDWESVPYDSSADARHGLIVVQTGANSALVKQPPVSPNSRMSSPRSISQGNTPRELPRSSTNFPKNFNLLAQAGARAGEESSPRNKKEVSPSSRSSGKGKKARKDFLPSAEATPVPLATILTESLGHPTHTEQTHSAPSEMVDPPAEKPSDQVQAVDTSPRTQAVVPQFAPGPMEEASPRYVYDSTDEPLEGDYVSAPPVQDLGEELQTVPASPKDPRVDQLQVQPVVEQDPPIQLEAIPDSPREDPVDAVRSPTVLPPMVEQSRTPMPELEESEGVVPFSPAPVHTVTSSSPNWANIAAMAPSGAARAPSPQLVEQEVPFSPAAVHLVTSSPPPLATMEAVRQVETYRIDSMKLDGESSPKNKASKNRNKNKSAEGSATASLLRPKSQTDWYASGASSQASIKDETSKFNIGTPFPQSSMVLVPPVVLPENDDDGVIISVSPSPAAKDRNGKDMLPVSHVLKLIILGDASVGKTALIQRFVTGNFQVMPYKPTVGADFYSQKLEYTTKSTGEKSLVTLQIWDTAGQERYKSLASSFYRGADVCILVEDASRPHSLASIAQWKADFLNYAAPLDPEEFPFIYLLNKGDTVEDPAEREEEWKQEVSEKFNDLPFRAQLVSAKTGDGVEGAFFTAAKAGVKRAVATTNQVTRNRATQDRNLISLSDRRTGDVDESSCMSQC